MKHCLIIDGNSIINRAFYGIRPLTASDGTPTNAIFGMINMVSHQLDALKPDYAAVAFDLKAPTFRHKMYREYKAGRRPTPEDLLAQFAPAKEILEAMGLHVLSLEGYEADDIQGTVAAMAAKEDVHAYILTGDRDLFQLISPRVSVLYAGNRDTTEMTPAAFCEKYIGITPTQFVDLKALMGDTSDHIPGVAGVGEKTALKLLTEFGTLDNLYDHIDSPSIAPKLKDKLVVNKESAYLSQTLARIMIDVPLGMTLADLSYRGIQNGALYRLLKKLDLNSFITRFHLTPEEIQAEDAPCTQVLVEYLPTDLVGLSQLDDKFAFHVLGEQIYLSDGKKHLTLPFSDDAVALVFRGGKSVVCYDGKSLYHLARDLGIVPACRFLDVGIYLYVLNSADTGGTPEKWIHTHPGRACDPTAPMAHHLFDLERKLYKDIEAIDCTFLLNEVELPLIAVLGDMEENGFLIDKEGLATYGEEIRQAAEKTANTIYEMVGHPFNLNSPKQLGEALFEDLKLPAPRKKKTGSYSTDADTLAKLRGEHPVIEEILLYRQLSKLHSTYVTSLIDACDTTGRIHTDFKQALTATGRLSSSEPNLQNIPIRTPLGRQIRHYFIPSPGCVLVDADYSQIELRLLAILSQDAAMTEAFLSGTDIHTATAASAFGVSAEEVTPTLRKRAKAINFGIVYGISAYSLSEDLGITPKEAKDYIEAYKNTYPAIDGYLSSTVSHAEEIGYTETLWHRRRYIPELKASNAIVRAFGKRVAMNAPLQGTAADVMKLAMVKVWHALKKELPEARLLMQVHDELVLECPPTMQEAASHILQREMESVLNSSVPLTVDVQVGTDWMK